MSRAEIQLWRWTVVDGVHRWAPQESTVTDGEGLYRFGVLEPGTYTAAMWPWTGRVPALPEVSRVHLGYPRLFLGGAAGVGGATRLRLRAGESQVADFVASPVPFYPVEIPVSGERADVLANITVEGEPSGLSLVYDGRRRALLGALPKGDYVVELRGGMMGQALSVDLPVHVADGAVRTAPVAPIAGVPLVAHVRMDWTQPQGNQVQSVEVGLLGVQGLQRRGGVSTPEHPDEVAIADVPAGEYRVVVRASHGYAAVVRCGGLDLLREPLEVGAGGAGCPLEITLRDDEGSLQGSVYAGEQAPVGAHVFLLPPRMTGEVREMVVRADGSFLFPELPPGRYEVYASAAEVPHLAWREPGALAVLAGRGVAVTVSPHGTSEVRVPVVAFAEDADAP